MGQLPAKQNALFYEFCLEKHIPESHPLRQIDQFLDFDTVRDQLEDFYSHTGRPSIDPELMIRMLLVGYCYGIRYERRLCEEINFNLAYRRFCRLGLEEAVPDHSTFSKNRHGRFRDADLLRMIFENVAQHCHSEGLIKGKGFATVASLIKADASRQRMVDGPVDWVSSSTHSRAVNEYLKALEEDHAARRPQKKVSVTDPMAQWCGNKGPGQFYYSTNYLIDIDYNIILDVEPSLAYRIAEVSSTQHMIDRVENMLGLKPDRLIADAGYGSAEMRDWVVETKHIAPHIPVLDKFSDSSYLFSRIDFKWDQKQIVIIVLAVNGSKSMGKL